MLKMNVKFEIEVNIVDLGEFALGEFDSSYIKDKFIYLSADQVEDIIFRSSEKDIINIDDDLKIIFADYHFINSKKVILLSSKKDDTQCVILNPSKFLKELEENYMEFYMQNKLSNLLKLDTEAVVEFQVK